LQVVVPRQSYTDFFPDCREAGLLGYRLTQFVLVALPVVNIRNCSVPLDDSSILVG
jgi:hypothetical protein